MLGRQKARVKRLTAVSDARGRQVLSARQALRAWARDTVASPATLAWVFSAGALWGTRRTGGAEGVKRSRLTRSVISAANAAWLLLRLARHVPKAAAPQQSSSS